MFNLCPSPLCSVKDGPELKALGVRTAKLTFGWSTQGRQTVETTFNEQNQHIQLGQPNKLVVTA